MTEQTDILVETWLHGQARKNTAYPEKDSGNC